MRRNAISAAARDEESEINLTPMLDVVFIMLIFFIVTANFIKEPGLEVNRPDSDTSEIQENAAILIAGVSSINKGSSETFLDTSINLSNCSSDIFPLLISLDLILDCSARILVDNCSDDISREKKATDDFFPASCIF